jgi:NAD(P)-dependent dehydrogenase (short-subunit alcohol dehydrogenase family)
MARSKLQLSGRTALVTGAAKRLGRATALALAAEGADVVIHYRTSEAEAAATADEVRDTGRKAWAVRGDLAAGDGAAQLFEEATGLAGPIDILVNSASIFPGSTVLGFTADELAENVQVNALSPLVLARALAAQGAGGDVVNFLDSRVTDYDRDHAAYHLSKRMLLSLTRMLALELAPGVRVNAVAPGLVLPPPGEDESYLERLASTNPLNRHGEADDVARAVVFLVTSPFVTGQVIYVDGGRHMRGQVYG